ncbi:phosphotransferase [Arthrobacter sp. GCM10027362]|uniref:phosphotransferase n=1 Tax=Arthrobacter sp. GCM10027362 TaxID=3273379 RepID=UPI00363DFC3F
MAALLHDLYDLDVTDTRVLGGEIDHNVRVTDAHGRRFLAKLTPASSPPEAVAWQESVLEHLAQRPISVEFPRMLPNRQGQVHCGVVVGGERYLLRLLNWIDGEMMATVEEHPPALLRRLGRVAAEITNALEGLVQPAGLGAHHWLVTRSQEAIEDSLDAVTDPECRRSVEIILGWFRNAAAVFDRLPTATVHQDLNDFNVLVAASDSGEARLAGVVDFNDAVTTIRVAEPAVAGAYAMLRKADPVSAFCEVVAGYRELIQMTDEELEVVFPLAAARLCVNAATWTKRTSQQNHRYGEARKQATWPTVLQIAKADPAEVASRIRRERT